MTQSVSDHASDSVIVVGQKLTGSGTSEIIRLPKLGEKHG
jgi:hypothetical protein